MQQGLEFYPVGALALLARLLLVRDERVDGGGEIHSLDLWAVLLREFAASGDDAATG